MRTGIDDGPPNSIIRDGMTHYEGCWKTRGHQECAEVHAAALEIALAERDAQIRTLTAQIAEREWISVSERLPQTEELVQVWRIDKNFHLDYGQCFFDSTGMRYWGMEVTHWQPLPAPPEVANGDK